MSTSRRSSAPLEELEAVRRRLGGVRIVEVPFAITGSVEHLRVELPTAMARFHGAENELRSAAAADAAAALAVAELDERAPHGRGTEITADLECAQQLERIDKAAPKTLTSNTKTPSCASRSNSCKQKPNEGAPTTGVSRRSTAWLRCLRCSV